MAFVEYSGEIVSSSKDKTFDKGSEGFKLDTVDDLSKQLGNNWWHLPATAIAGAGLGAAGRAVYDWYKSRQAPDQMTRIEPTMAPEPVDKLQQAKERLLAGQRAGIGVEPPVGPVNAPTTPQASVPPTAAPAPTAGPAQPPVAAPAAPPNVPSAAEAVATGQSPAKAVQMDVAQQLDEANRMPVEQAQPKGSAKPKGRPAGAKTLTPEQRSMIKAAEVVEGGRNWLLNQFGKDPVAYEKYIRQFNQGQDYPNYSSAVQSISQNLGGPEKSQFLSAQKGEIAGTQKALMGPVPPKVMSQQGGFIDLSPAQLTPFGQGAAQVGRQVVGDLKMGAAALPFALATDVRQQNVGYEKELKKELQKAKDPDRIQVLQNELQKLEEGRYLQAMYDRFVKQNVPQQYRPALTR